MADTNATAPVLSQAEEVAKAKPKKEYRFLNYWPLVVVLLCAWGAVQSFHHHFLGWDLSDQSSDWSNFGGYLSGTVGILTAIANLFVLLHISYTLQRAAKSKEAATERLKTLFALHLQWSIDLLVQRNAADLIRQRDPFCTIKKLHGTDGEGAVWQVFGFFQTLQVAIESELVDRDKAVVLFGQIFTWWRVVFIPDGWPKKWDTYCKLAKLKNIVEQEAGDKVGDWIATAREDLEKYKKIAVLPLSRRPVL